MVRKKKDEASVRSNLTKIVKKKEGGEKKKKKNKWQRRDKKRERKRKSRSSNGSVQCERIKGKSKKKLLGMGRKKEEGGRCADDQGPGPPGDGAKEKVKEKGKKQRKKEEGFRGCRKHALINGGKSKRDKQTKWERQGRFIPDRKS